MLAWLVSVMLCKEEGFSNTGRRDMDLYEVSLSLYFGMGTMLANFHMCGIIVNSSF